MPDWTHKAVLITPISLISVANKIAQAFDPDVGGSDSFDVLRIGNPPTHAVCDTPVIAATGELFLQLKQSPEMLHQMCLADYTARWPEQVPPTLEECQAFIQGTDISVHPFDTALVDVLSAKGLGLYIPESQV